MSTVVVDFQEELLALVTPVLEAEGVHCGPELPREVPKHAERFYVLDETGYTLGGGEQYREESFAGRFVVEVFKAGDHVQETKRRRWELIELIDNALTEADFYGYRTMGFALSVESSAVALDTGWISRGTCSIGIREEF